MIELGLRLQHLLEDVNVNLYAEADALSDQLFELKKSITKANKDLSRLKSMLCGDLAFEFRRRFPALNISVDGKRCKVGYRSKIMVLEPDVIGKIWTVRADNVFAKSFVNRYRRFLIFDNNCAKLVDVIGEYFSNHFKSLNEEVSGTGILLIDGKNSTVSDLVGMRSGSEFVIEESLSNVE